MENVLDVLWFWAERDDVMPDQAVWATRIVEVSGWAETDAIEGLRRAEADVERWPNEND